MLPAFNLAEVINEQEVKPFLDRLHRPGVKAMSLENSRISCPPNQWTQ